MKTAEKPWRPPWWLYLALAIGVYLGLHYFLPAFLPGVSPQFLKFAQQLAPIITIAFLVLAANALYRNDSPSPPTNDDNEKPDEEL